MKLSSVKFIGGFLFVAVMSVFMAGCLNDDNKIPPNCYDGILNNEEENIDCGGPNCPLCDPCENGIWEPELGEQWVDCGGECDPCDPSFNGQLDPGEEGIDCGGDTGIDCGELCGDGLLNGFEEEVDCGGTNCEACPTCDDMILNQDEIGIDCGGSECMECPDGVDCTNGLLDGDELYVDCGGTFCNPCEEFLRYRRNGGWVEADVTLDAMMNGNDIVIATQASDPASQFGATLAEPAGLGWVPNVTIDMDVSTFPGSAATLQAEDSFTSGTATASFTFEIQYVVPGSGGVVVGTFDGTLKNADESASAILTQGSFLLLID